MEQKLIMASDDLVKKIKKSHLTARQMAFADLVNVGYVPFDAFQLVGMYDDKITPQMNKKIMREMMTENENFVNYIPPYIVTKKTTAKKAKANEEVLVTKEGNVETIDTTPQTTSKPEKHEITEEEMAELLSKENQLRELLWKLKHEELDTKTEMEVRKMIADLTQVKKEQTQVEDKRTIFYLPLKCYNCSLYIKSKKKK